MAESSPNANAEALDGAQTIPPASEPGGENSDAPHLPSDGLVPPPPPMTQAAVAQRIGQLLFERQFYRDMARDTLSKTQAVAEALGTYANAPAATDRLAADDFDNVGKTIDAARMLVGRIEELNGTKARLAKALKQAEAQSFKMRAWLIGGGVLLLIIIMANAR